MVGRIRSEPHQSTDRKGCYEIPTYSINHIMLTRLFDATQAIVLKEENIIILLKKVNFLNGYFFIYGCSNCNPIVFAVLYETSTSLHYDTKSNETCAHMLKALGTFLFMIGSWAPKMTESEIQETLKNNCIVENNSTFFFDQTYGDFCGSILKREGVILFHMKNEAWQCTSCKVKANKCKHGKSVDLPEFNSCVVLKEPSLKETLLLSNYCFTGNL